MPTLYDLVTESVERFPSLPALSVKAGYRLRKWSYAGLARDVEKASALLRDRGIGQGDRVFIWGDNSPYWVLWFLGLLRIGGVGVPVDVRSEPGFLTRVIEAVEPKLALVSHRLARRWEYDLPVVEMESLEDAPEPVDPAPAASVDDDDITEVVFTSGTTGTPKGVMLTHRNIRANVRSIDEIIPVDTHHRVMSLLPLSHMLEQTAGDEAMAGRVREARAFVQDLDPRRDLDELRADIVRHILRLR
jgi:long-chain acyl-CoA synthetase